MIPIPSEQLYHPVRVCDDCFSTLDAKQKPNHWTKDDVLDEDDLVEKIEENTQQETETVQQSSDDDHASISGQQTPPPP